jgi:hypothetical protein
VPVLFQLAVALKSITDPLAVDWLSAVAPHIQNCEQFQVSLQEKRLVREETKHCQVFHLSRPRLNSTSPSENQGRVDHMETLEITIMVMGRPHWFSKSRNYGPSCWQLSTQYAPICGSNHSQDHHNEIYLPKESPRKRQLEPKTAKHSGSRLQTTYHSPRS